MTSAALAFHVLGVLAFITGMMTWLCRPLSKKENHAPLIACVILAVASLVFLVVALGLSGNIYSQFGSAARFSSGWPIAGCVLGIVMVGCILILQGIKIWGSEDFAILRALITWLAFLFFWVLAAGCGIAANAIRGSSGIVAAAFSFLLLSSITTGTYYIAAGHASDADAEGETSR